MLHRIANKITNILIEKNIIPERKKRIYIYGFELLGSFVFFVSFATIMSLIFGYAEQLLTFMLFFIPIRVVGGGYHAKSYSGCFVLSNIVALVGVKGSMLLWEYRCKQLDMALWCLLMISSVYIWKNVPINSKVNPLTTCQLNRNRKYSHKVLSFDLGLILCLWIFFNSNVVYTAMVTICFVACFILITKKRGKRIWRKC